MKMIAMLLALLLSQAHAADKSACSSQVTPPTQQAAAHGHKTLDTYVPAMEKSALQKGAYAALTRAGKVADLGSGSGISAFHLAVLFPDSQVVGVDLDPKMLEYAKSHYQHSNLDFIQGNAELVNFPANTLSGIFMSSTGHHLTSFGDGVFDTRHIMNAFQAAHYQLQPGGMFIYRDFVVPDGSERLVNLDLPNHNGVAAGEDTKALSTSAMFRLFAKDFRSSRHPMTGVPFEVVGQLPDGWTRFRLTLRDATEFLLRKDYRENYHAEIKEEYTYMTQSEMEKALRVAGFRVMHSALVHNPWIVSNRFRGHVRLSELNGATIPFPATNYIIAGEKVGLEEGIGFRQVEWNTIARPNFLRVIAMKNTRTQVVHDIVERPNETFDVLPYFTTRDKRIYVMGKQGFPRPILTTIEKHLSGSHSDGYVVEPISFINSTDKSEFSFIEEQLAARAGIKPQQILARGPGEKYRFYSSPGMVSERVTSIAIPIRARPISSEYTPANYSGFSTSGFIRPFEATQVLRSAQVGSVLDARMEIGVYHLLLDRKASVGQWIGEEISASQDLMTVALQVQDAEKVLGHRSGGREFKRVEDAQFGSFLEVRRGKFAEYNFKDETLASADREYVIPKKYSTSVASVIPFIKRKGEILIGVEERHLPGVQLNEGQSSLVTNPAWRLSPSVNDMDAAVEEMLAGLQKDFATRGAKHFTLGGPYHPTPGVTSETVHPFAVEVDPSSLAQSKLKWVSLRDLIEHRRMLKDANLLVGAFRLAHAVGVLK